MSRVLDNEQIHVLINRHLFQAGFVQGDLQNALLLTGRELARQVDFEFLDQLRHTVSTTTRVADRIFHHLFVKTEPSVNSRVIALAMARFSGL